eukprot:TCONS_00072065-protein
MEGKTLILVISIQCFVHVISMVNTMKCQSKKPLNNHGVSPITFIDKERNPSAGTLLAVIPRMSTEWSVEFDIKLTKDEHYSVHSLIHFTATGNEFGAVGDR